MSACLAVSYKFNVSVQVKLLQAGTMVAYMVLHSLLISTQWVMGPRVAHPALLQGWWAAHGCG
jgi:hypothetical protein